MKNCPTCGQAILPSMGTRGIRLQPAPIATLILHIGNSAVSLRPETTPRGYKAQHIHRENGKRHRIRLMLQTFPRKGTISCKLTIIALGVERNPVVHDLPEQPTTYPNAPFQHDWQTLMNLNGVTQVRIELKTLDSLVSPRAETHEPFRAHPLPGTIERFSGS